MVNKMENENNDYYEYTIKTSRTTTRNENYYQLDYANELTKLNVEKQRLISFLEERINLCDKDIKEFSKDYNVYFRIVEDTKTMKRAFQEVLDFVNKGGKDE